MGASKSFKLHELLEKLSHFPALEVILDQKPATADQNPILVIRTHGKEHLYRPTQIHTSSMSAMELAALASGEVPAIAFGQSFTEKQLRAFEKNKINFVSDDGQIRLVHPRMPAVNLKSKSEKKGKGDASLRFLFTVLDRPALLNEKQRDIASWCDISLGAVNIGIRNLVTAGAITPTTIGFTFSRGARKRLIESWSQDYLVKLRPRILQGRFRFLGRSGQRPFALPGTLLWGGEWAAENFFRGEIRGEGIDKTLFTRETLSTTLKTLKAVRIAEDDDESGSFRIYTAFWNPDLDQYHGNVPPLIAYAELMGSRSSRMHEIGRELLADFLRTK